MKILKSYSENVVNYDLIHKFNFKTVQEIPKLREAVLTFSLNKYDFKDLLTTVAALKMISEKKMYKVSSSSIAKISLKIKKGYPVGSVVVLRKKHMMKFLFNIINLGWVKSEYIKPLIFKQERVFSCRVLDPLKIKILEKNYQFFQSLPVLDIHLITTAEKKPLLFFLIKSYKLL
jgi:ribosomal protein L5